MDATVVDGSFLNFCRCSCHGPKISVSVILETTFTLDYYVFVGKERKEMYERQKNR